MLIGESKIYIYAVARDFGFAPNPFHGFCTLATCKPRIRSRASVNDWVIGMGGSRLRANGRCIFAMRVDEKSTFNEYWGNPSYFDKKPVRNGSRKMMVGDNVYHFKDRNKWSQADSHHSNPDGSVNSQNLSTDTQADQVLISQHFFYFGQEAPYIPGDLLNSIGYEKNPRDYRVFKNEPTSDLIHWLYSSFQGSLNQVVSDPFDFENSEKRYSPQKNSIVS